MISQDQGSGLSSVTALALLLGLIVACGGSGIRTNHALENLLGASTPKEFNDQFMNHGPIREEELPAIFEATASAKDARRRNAAKLLRTTVKGNAVELENRLVLETKYVDAWAIVLDDVLQREQEMAGRRPDMIKAALDDSDTYTLAVGLRAAVLSNYPGAHELARKYLDHKDPKVRAAAVSGLTAADVRELLPKLNEMVSTEKDEDTFIMLAKSLIRTNDPTAADIVVKSLERQKDTGDNLYVHFFNDLALFTPPDPIVTKFLLSLARGKSGMRDEGFSVLSRWVWSMKREPLPDFVHLCIDEIQRGNLSTDPRRRPEASSEQNECEEMLSFVNDGKNPIGNFEGRIRGSDAIVFAKKWLKEHGG
jgi:HEAT repeats